MNANPVGRTATLTKGRRWAALAVLTASLLVITMDMTILNIALPELAGELQPTAEQQLWIIDIYSLVLAGLLVSWSAIADRGQRSLIAGAANACSCSAIRSSPPHHCSCSSQTAPKP